MTKEKTAQINEQLVNVTKRGIKGIITAETINGILNCECIQQNIEISHRKIIF